MTVERALCRHGTFPGVCDRCLDDACERDRANLTELLNLQVLDTNELVTFRPGPRGSRRRRGKPL